jgi:hypothetical protein
MSARSHKWSKLLVPAAFAAFGLMTLNSKEIASGQMTGTPMQKVTFLANNTWKRLVVSPKVNVANAWNPTTLAGAAAVIYSMLPIKQLKFKGIAGQLGGAALSAGIIGGALDDPAGLPAPNFSYNASQVPATASPFSRFTV